MTEIKTQQAVADFAEFVAPGKVARYQAMGALVVPGKSEGIYLVDSEGRRWINCRSSGGVFNFGHRPPALIAALHQALDESDIGDHLLLSAKRAELGRRLAEVMPGDIHYTTYSVSGGEAIDLAIKLARAATGKQKIMSVLGGYHGHTGLALAAGDAEWRDPFGPQLPGFQQIPFGDVGALEAALDDNTAAIILETILATAGIQLPPPDYLATVRRLCDQRSIAYVADEVQAGLGRTGQRWAFEEWGIIPDIVVLGKGLSGAVYPIAVTCCRPWVYQPLVEHPFLHLSTFGGADLGCAVALKVLDLLTPELLAHVRDRGVQLTHGLLALAERLPGLIREVRGRGLMIGLELMEDQWGLMLTMLLVQRGVLALYANNRPATLIIMPPLIISEAETALLLEHFAAALSQLASIVLPA